jgi:hypothetical protein
MEIFAAYDWKPFQSCYTKIKVKSDLNYLKTTQSIGVDRGARFAPNQT